MGGNTDGLLGPAILARQANGQFSDNIIALNSSSPTMPAVDHGWLLFHCCLQRSGRELASFGDYL
jgi:hypothetical protein